MTMDSAQAWVILIASLGSVIVAIVTALKTQRVETKVDSVHSLADGRLSHIEAELKATRQALVSAREDGAQTEKVQTLLAKEAVVIAIEQASVEQAQKPLIVPATS